MWKEKQKKIGYEQTCSLWRKDMDLGENLFGQAFKLRKEILFGCMHLQFCSKLNPLPDKTIPGILPNDTGWCFWDQVDSPLNCLCMAGVVRYSQWEVLNGSQLLIGQQHWKWMLRELFRFPINQVRVLSCLKVDFGNDIWTNPRRGNSLLLHVVQL